jgi:hypothetical protein
MTSETTSAASRICLACGLCCDGTLFQIVRMQPEDHPDHLASLGLRLRHRGGDAWMEQPCPALQRLSCTVYDHRPQRCRRFHCQQLTRLASGHIDEGDALVLIADTRRLADLVRQLLARCGYREDGAPLQEQFDRLTSTPVDPTLEPELAETREQLQTTMRQLKLRLARDFLPPPVSSPPRS